MTPRSAEAIHLSASTLPDHQRPLVENGVTTGPLTREPDETMTVPWLLTDRVARAPRSTLIERKSPLGNKWVKVTAEAFLDDVNRVAAGLMGMGLQAGETVGIMAHTSYEWTLLDFAIATAGLVSVPVYETDSADQIEWILEDAGLRLVVAETTALAEVARSAVASFGSSHPDAAPTEVLSLDRDALTTIVSAGDAVSNEDLEARRDAVRGSGAAWSLLYLGMVDEAEEAVGAFGQNLSDVLEQEPDAALGNGGLGRLAACFLDSCATLDLPVQGYGILYRYGLFKQLFNDGFQTEHPDSWMEEGYPFVIRREEAQRIVRYNDLTVRAVPYDMPITGYGTDNVGTLRLWDASPIAEFDYDAFNSQRFADAILVTARRDPEAPASEQSLVVVPREHLSLERTSEWDALGLRGTMSEGFELEGTVSADMVLPVDFATISAQTMLPASHTLWASSWLGLATGAGAVARRFIQKKARSNPGTTPPGALRLAELEVRIQSMIDTVRSSIARLSTSSAM